MLHQADLGVFKTLMDIVHEISKELHVNPIPELDRRLMVIKDSSHFFLFRVPGNERGGYFTSNANFLAAQHRSVMQVSQIPLQRKKTLLKNQCFVLESNFLFIACESD
jgi:hypothetical protein